MVIRMINCSPHSWFPAPPCTLGTCPGRRGAERRDELVDHHQTDHDQRMVIIMIVMSMMLTCSTRPVGPSSHPATAIPPLLYSSVSGGTMTMIMISMIMIMMIVIRIMIRMITMFVTIMIMIAQLLALRSGLRFYGLIIVSVSVTLSFQESQRPFIRLHARMHSHSCSNFSDLSLQHKPMFKI